MAKLRRCLKAKLSVFVFLLCPALLASPLKATVVKKWFLPADKKVEKKKIGGISGCSIANQRIYFVSDDRGAHGGPRIISFPYNTEKNELDLASAEILKIKGKSKILDLEGIGVLKDGRVLLSSEGDLNQKPRVMPELFWTDQDGNKSNSIQIPAEYLPEKSGKQTKGIQNNLAFEGLVVDSEEKLWAAILEAPLLQSPGTLRLVESSLESNKFDKTYLYPIPTDLVPENISGYFGAADLLHVNSSTYLILERGVEASLSGVSFRTQLCLAKKNGDSNMLRRDCFYNMNTDSNLTADLPHGANFEGLCWIDKQKKLFMVVSDNNFSKNEKTSIILYQVY